MAHSDRAVFDAFVKANADSREANRKARLAAAAGSPAAPDADVEAAVAAILTAGGLAAPQPPKTYPATPEGAAQAVLDARALALGLRN